MGTSVIFITHKLGEVLELADRITVLRRGKAVETVPRAGRDRGEPGPAHGRARSAPARRQAAGPSGRSRCSRCATCGVADDRDLEAVRGVSLEVRAGEIVGHRRRRRQRPVRARRGDHRPAPADRGHDHGRRPRPEPCQRPGQHQRRQSATSPRTASGAASCSSSRWPRTWPCTTTADRRPRGSASSRHGGSWRSARGLLTEFDVRGGGPQTLASSALGREPAEGRDRPRALRQPRPAGGGAAHPRPRRGRDRVRPPATGRGARPRPRDPSHQLRARRDPRAVRPDPGDVPAARSWASMAPTSPSSSWAWRWPGGGRETRGVSEPRRASRVATESAPG